MLQTSRMVMVFLYRRQLIDHVLRPMDVPFTLETWISMSTQPRTSCVRLGSPHEAWKMESTTSIEALNKALKGTQHKQAR